MTGKQNKIYTRQGDKGQTSLIGGKRVPKYHDRIEAYGTVDELIAYVGLIRDHGIDKADKDFLLMVQDRLMVCASELAADCDDCKIKIPEIESGDIAALEDRIDKMEKGLPPLTSFILPGGLPVSSLCHIARNVCRRAERRTIFLAEKEKINEYVLKYLNRLSDYFFVLARKLTKDFNVEEIPWKPNL
ncbi:MAG: cob(I)yrinic acid a,c-diamide adenosyltransferase [Bacteroidota bacterium]